MIERNKLGQFKKGHKQCKALKEYQKTLKEEGNPFYGKNHTKEAKEKIRQKHIGKKKANLICKHHIDLVHENNNERNLLKLTNSKHHKLHWGAYEYIVKIGKIKEYIKWFTKEYGLK